jgi:aromatic ring-opening dioxygenase LigB subunit
VTLAEVARGAGTLHWEGRKVETNLPVDDGLTDAIAAAARDRNVPIALTGFAGNRRYQSSIPLDWGVITPAWFIGHDQNIPGSGDVLAPNPERDSGPPLVIVNPSRALPREANVEFGRAVAAAAAATGRQVGFIASCDWGHCHSESGPYGYHEASARVDAQVVDAVRRNDIRSLIGITDEDVQNSAIDGLWQLLMLDGAIEGRRATVDVLCYEAPTYYGMLTATWALEA